MLFSKIYVWFIVYSCMGWIFESIYCTLKEKKWQERGFLYGPICPIYGCGATAISLIAEYTSGSQLAELTWWQLFLIGYFGSIVLEYSTSWFLEKRFGALWWDYSNMPLNIHGRVCFPASCGFGAAGILIVRIIFPFVSRHTLGIDPLWMELISLIMMAIMGADLALTVSALTNFQRQLISADELINAHMDQFVDNAFGKADAASAKLGETKALIGEKRNETMAAIEEKKAETAALIAAERERFSLQNMERMARNMSRSRMAALSRVKRFTNARDSEKTQFGHNKVHAFIKNYRENRGSKQAE